MLLVARQIKRNLIQYHQGRLPNIALVSLIRGGSTLVSDMIAAQRGIWFFDEPFAYRNRDWPDKRMQLSQEKMGKDRRFFDLDSSEKEEVLRYLERLNGALVRTKGTSRRPYFPLTSNRTCLKILRGAWLTDLLADCGMQVIFSLRHPAAQSLSLMRLKWPAAAHFYFKRPEFLAKYFTSENIEYGQRILAQGSRFQELVLSWVMDVVYPLQYSQNIAFQLFYEHLLIQPDKSIQQLSETCQLDDPVMMKAILQRPSGSSGHSTPGINQAIMARDFKTLLNKWYYQLDEEDKRRGQEVLDRFGIRCYSMFQTLPLLSEP